MITKKMSSHPVSVHADLFSKDKYYSMSKERWEGIVECKKRFLNDKDYDPFECPYMHPDIAASWIRSRKMGVDPHQPYLGRILKKDEFSHILDKNRLLIEISKPLVNSFKSLAISSAYGFYLADNKGVFLLHEGEMLSLPIDASLIGMVWDEKTVGTTAHSLSLLHSCPFHVAGIENYCVGLENIIASAAPIQDDNGKTIATFVLAQMLIDEPWRESYQKYCSNTLGLITAISTAVESQLKLQRSFTSLKMANETLEATLALIDEGIITIDQNGTIIYCNEEGRKIFRLSPDEMDARNICEFLSEESTLVAMATRGESGIVEETIYIDKSDEQYIINIQPIMDEDTQELDVALLTINNVGKINAITTNRAGAVARFTFGDIIGESDVVKKAITKGQYYSRAAENILLIGESGTGKELFAQAIHNRYCSSGPFIAVNCAALPRELIESELFGYEGGSFTGADRSGRPGKIELAEGGTIFLDEIGDMPFELQAVLLRVLEDKQVMRIGGRRYKKVDFRVVAATNQNLNSMVKERLFREDLYYRLSVLTIAIPPLRDRNRDPELLANYFVKKYCKKMGRKVPQFSTGVLEIINGYNWPGNVRELENAMIYSVINADGEMINVLDMPEDIVSKGNFKPSLETITHNFEEEKTGDFPSLTDIEKRAITKALTKTEGNVILAACLLGISKSTIYRKLKEYDIPH
ncbi:MAG TPA: sigma 54-interacting transcriptional regulator [Syntrophomonadaceae bacterium]|nr:sigma 54-interacting transcriptional regulator [Syntrophomonadaceae bacterium]